MLAVLYAVVFLLPFGIIEAIYRTHESKIARDVGCAGYAET